MHTEGGQGAPGAASAAAVSRAKEELTAFLAEESAALLTSLRLYVQRMGLARGAAVQATAQEVLQEVAVEALDHAARFDPERQPLAWLLGIALNVIRRRKAEWMRHAQHEISPARLSQTLAEPLSESELFDRLLPNGDAGPEAQVEAGEQAAALLALVSEDDREILRLAFLYDFEREAIAQQLGISPVAARVRLHRALSRLRSAWREQATT